MKGFTKKLFSILVAILILLNALPFFVVAEDAASIDNSFNISVAITVTERNGTAVSGYPVRRSVPFKKGELMPDTSLAVKDGSTLLPSDTEVMETYPDGSVKWLLVSFTVDMKANEQKILYLTDGSYEGNLSYDDNTGAITNGKVSMNVTESGVKNLKGRYDAAEKIELYVRENDETYILKDATVSILAKTESYIKARISGTFTKGIDGVMEITLPDNSERVQIDYRINTKRNAKIVSTGLLINGKHNNAAGSRITDNVLSFSGMDVISYDNKRFSGAIKNSLTGFTIENGNIVRLSPLLNFTNKNNSYMFYDGTARTCHAYFCLGGVAGHSEAVENPLSVSISPTVYKNAGILYSDILTAPANEIIQTIKTMKGKLDGRFEAGAIPLGLDSNLEVSDGFNSRPGETEYNLGYGYMMSGEEDLYTLIMDSAENWADVVIYKGQYDQIYGANRSHTGDDLYNGDDNAFRSFPYYGEAGGLYMAYILSGNEYFKEVFLACCDHFVNTMYLKDSKGNYLTKNFGNFMISKWFWQEDGSNSIGRSDFTESRYMMPARPLYLAYQLTGKEDYRRAALDIGQWAHDKQQPDGSWPQAYFHYKVEKVLDENGNETYDSNGRVVYKKIYYDENETYDDKYGAILIQGNQQEADDSFEGLEPYKLYIMLFGYRGVTDVMHWEENDVMKETLLKFADYLCYQNESFGPGLYHPNGDREVYPENEDSTFSKGTATDLMALEVLAKAYEVSGDIRHLKNMCSLMESYLCSAYGGLGFDTISEEGYKSFSLSPVLGRSMTYLKSASYISYIMEENSELISNLGYKNLLIAFARNSESAELIECVDFAEPSVTHNEYILNGEKAIFAAANTPLNINNDGYLRFKAKENNLWQGDGVVNCVESQGALMLKKEAKQFQLLTAIQRPIQIVPDEASSVQAVITEYTETSVKMRLEGVGTAKIHINDGLFSVSEGTEYSVTETLNDDGSIDITVAQGAGDVLTERTLTQEVSLGTGYYYDNFNRDSGFDMYSFSGDVTVKDFPGIKDKSLYLENGESVTYSLLSEGKVSVISQDFCCGGGNYILMETDALSIDVNGENLYIGGKQIPYSALVENIWFNLTVVFDYQKEMYEIYINRECVFEGSLSQIVSGVTYTGGEDGVYIDNFFAGCYETQEDAYSFLSQILHRELNEFEKDSIARIESLKLTEGESAAFYAVADEILHTMKNTFVDAKVKTGYIDMLERLEECAEDKERWLIMGENFEGDMSTKVKEGNSLGGAVVLAATDAVLNRENGALRLQKLEGEKSSRILIRSKECADDIEVNFRYMQPWLSANPYIYYCGDTDQKDYAVRIGSTENRIYCYNGNNGGQALLIDYEAGRWYDFSVHIHYITRTYDVYIDGELKAEGVAFSSLNNNFERPDIGRVFNAITGKGCGSYYYDDIYIYGKTQKNDRISIIKMNNTLGDYLMARANIISESLEKKKLPMLIAGIFSGNELIKLVRTASDENGLLKARIYAKDLSDGKYTIKTFLWTNDEKIVPVSVPDIKEFIVTDKTISD